MARILVADDEKDMVTGLRDNLQFEGYEVSVAFDGEAALAEATTNSPDLILLDIMMPKMEGLEPGNRHRTRARGRRRRLHHEALQHS